jgi:hypothetical protein
VTQTTQKSILSRRRRHRRRRPRRGVHPPHEAALNVRVLLSHDHARFSTASANRPLIGAISILLTAGALVGEEGVAAAGHGAGRGKEASGAPAGAVGGSHGRMEVASLEHRAAERSSCRSGSNG